MTKILDWKAGSSPVTVEELVLRWQKKGDAGAKEKVLRTYEGLANTTARRYNAPMIPVEDRQQVAMLGVDDAINTYDHRQNTRFGTHVNNRIRIALSRLLRKDSRFISNPTWLHDAKVKLYKVRQTLTQTLGREPTEQELKSHSGLADWVFRAAIQPEPRVESLVRGTPGQEWETKDVYEEDATDSSDTRIVLQSYLDELPSEQATAVWMHHAEGFEIADVAKAMNLNTKSVAAILDKGRKNLRELFKRDGMEWGDLQANSSRQAHPANHHNHHP